MEENKEAEAKKIPEVIAFTESSDEYPWHKPDKDEMWYFASSMFFKYLRLILTDIILVGCVLLPFYISLSMGQLLALIGVLAIFLIIYSNYRRYDMFQLARFTSDTFPSKVWTVVTSSGTFISVFVSLIVGALAYHKLRLLAAVPLLVMLIVLQIKEWYMLVLLAKGKYKIKNGITLSGEKEIRIDDKVGKASDGGDSHEFSLIIIYIKTFSDHGGRTLTVTTDFYTYHFARRSKPAMLLSFDNGWYVIAKGGRKKTRS